jgi:hypothetical protein
MLSNQLFGKRRRMLVRVTKHERMSMSAYLVECIS